MRGLDRRGRALAAASVLMWTLLIALDFALAGSALSQSIALATRTVIACFSGGIVLSVAARIPKGEPLRARWAVIGLGIVIYVIGELSAGYLMITGMDPLAAPGIAEVFFVSSRIALAIGLMDAAMSVRRFGSAVTPLVMSLIVCLTLLALSAQLLSGILADTNMPPLQKALALYVPVGGIFLGVLPALLVAFSMALKGGRLGWPWIPVSAGMIAISLGDILDSWRLWGGLADIDVLVGGLWIGGFTLFALGALAQSAVEETPELAVA